MGKRVLLIMLTTMLLSNCKEETKKTAEDSNVVIEKAEENKSLTKNSEISLNAKILNDDTIRLYYGYLGEAFSEERVVYLPVKGSENIQDIVFKLPQKETLEQLRIHFGKNNKDQEILLNKFIFKIGGNEFFVSAAELTNYFSLSPSFSLNKENLTLTPKEINNSYDPHLLSNKNLIEKLIELQ